MVELQAAVRVADAVVVSFGRMMEINYFRGRDGLTVRLDEEAVKAILASDLGLWFVRNFTFVEFSQEQREDLVRRSLERLAGLVKPGARVISLSFPLEVDGLELLAEVPIAVSWGQSTAFVQRKTASS